MCGDYDPRVLSSVEYHQGLVCNPGYEVLGHWDSCHKLEGEDDYGCSCPEGCCGRDGACAGCDCYCYHAEAEVFEPVAFQFGWAEHEGGEERQRGSGE